MLTQVVAVRGVSVLPGRVDQVEVTDAAADPGVVIEVSPVRVRPS
jgi:hypothetical protein